MRIRRSVSLGLVASLALPWAGALVVAGLWVLISGGTWLGLSPTQRVAAGVSGVAAGSLVFTFCVADRLFPGASRGVVWAAEVFTCLTMLAGLSLLALSVAP
ncbi:MAG: hypothetical protein ACIARR_10740 [Phycisphaerales bacterium JB059]